MKKTAGYSRYVVFVVIVVFGLFITRATPFPSQQIGIGDPIPVSSAGEYERASKAHQESVNRRYKELAKTRANPKLRRPWEEGNDYSDNEFTTTDKARLTSIAADIVALIDPEPISALTLGVASDVTNLVADLYEGYSIFNSAGNFVSNIGLSVVSMIPIFGDAVGSGGKVVKTLIKFMPKLRTTLLLSGVLEVVSNGDEIMKSFNKIGKDGPDNKMNVEDWRNISLGIQLVLGGANAAKNVKTVKNLHN